MNRKIIGVLVFLLSVTLIVFASNPGFANGSVAQVKVDPNHVISQVKPMSIGGMNVNNSMVIIKIKDMVDALKIPTITYPAGNIADDDIMIDLNSEKAFKSFLLQQKLLNRPYTFVQTRLYKGTSQMAAESVQRAKTIGVRVDVWTIGNEPDLYAPHKGDRSWTKEKYNRVFREYAEAIRDVDPDAKLAGPIPSNPKDDWIESFIYENGDIVDVLMWHWYPTDGSWSDENALATAPDIISQINRYRSWLTDPEKNPKGYKRDISLAVSEYALHWKTPVFRHLTDMVAAMWTAEVAGYMAQYGLDYSHFFCLGEYGGHAVFEQPPSYLERPVFYVFKFYANHFGNQMIQATSSDSKVKAFASKDEQGKNYLMLINQNPDESIETVITLPKGVTFGKIHARIVSDDFYGEDLPSDKITLIKEKLHITLPPYSIVSVEM